MDVDTTKNTIEKHCRVIVEDCLKGQEYNSDKGAELCHEISIQVVEKLKEVLDKYKILTFTLLMPLGSAQLTMAGAC